MRYLRILALVALCLAYAPMPAVAVTGYDSAYNSESAFVTINPGETQSFQVFFFNGGATAWIKGTDSQVDLAACLEDKVTCNAQDAGEATWNSGWLSATRYATTTQASVARGEVATFSYNIKAPASATGTHRFNGDLVVAMTGTKIHAQGYYQDATVNAIGQTGPTPTPGSTPFPSPKVVATPTPAPTPKPLNFTMSPWAYACGETTYGNPAIANDIPAALGPCPLEQYGAPAVTGTATASFANGTLSLSKTGAINDDLSSGATIGGITHLTSATYDVAGYCGNGAPRLSVWTDFNGNGVWDEGDTPHAFGCAFPVTNNVDGHVDLDLTAAGNGYGTGAVSPSDVVVRMNFVFDELGATSMSSIKFNGMGQ